MNHDHAPVCMLAVLLAHLYTTSLFHTFLPDSVMAITSRVLTLVSLIAALAKTQSTVGPVVNLGYAQVHPSEHTSTSSTIAVVLTLA